MPQGNKVAPGAEREVARLGPQPLSVVLEAFAAGQPVPGSGSATALTAAIGACLTTSVALKTSGAKGTAYIHVRQTALDVERQARRLSRDLQNLLEDDSAAFAPVIALRRSTGRIDDPLRQDEALRAEIKA